MPHNANKPGTQMKDRAKKRTDGDPHDAPSCTKKHNTDNRAEVIEWRRHAVPEEPFLRYENTAHRIADRKKNRREQKQTQKHDICMACGLIKSRDNGMADLRSKNKCHDSRDKNNQERSVEYRTYKSIGIIP